MFTLSRENGKNSDVLAFWRIQFAFSEEALKANEKRKPGSAIAARGLAVTKPRFSVTSVLRRLFERRVHGAL
jgi:hypothetical protein